MKTSIRMSKQISTILLIAGLVFACSKDGNTGAVGPQGAQGEQGIAGSNGADGEDGEQGETGTANVIYSDWIANGFSPGGGLQQKLYTIADTDEINSLDVDLETSTVLVYGRGNVLAAPGDEVFPLPYNNTASTERYTYTINNGQIRLVGLTSNVANNDFDLFDDYRYIIIPGGQSAEGSSGPGDIAGKSAAKNHGQMTYIELITALNIPE